MKSKKLEEKIKCECGYYNKINKIKLYGICKGCNKILDPKAKYKYEMYCRLHLWKGKKWYG